MSTEYKIAYEEKPQDAAWGIVGRGVGVYNEQQVGDDSQMLSYVVQGPDQEIVGGLIGQTHMGWFYLDLLWVKEELRGQGYGRQLVTLAEEEARKRGAKNAYLDTFSFQAPAFYEKLGYQVFGELPNFPTGHTRYYYKKEI